MKRLIIFFIVFNLCIFTPTPMALVRGCTAWAQEKLDKNTEGNSKIVDGIAAIVNGEIITISEIDEAAKPVLDARPYDIEAGDAEKISREIKKEILEQMIEDKLLLQEARAQGVALTEEETARAKESLLIKKMVSYKITGIAPEVTEKEIIDFYELNKDDFSISEQVRARHIFFKASDNSKVEWLKAEAKARKVLDLFGRGERFEELAGKYSEDEVSREKGGDLGYLNYGQTILEFERAAFSLKNNGEVSDLIKTPYGYHIIKLEDRKERHFRKLEEVREEIKAVIMQQKEEKEFHNWIEGLRKKSAIEVRIK